MSDQWMPTLRFPLAFEDFRRLPRHPAYQYGHVDGIAHICPNPRHYHAILEFSSVPSHATGDASFAIEPFDRAKHETALLGLFSAAFSGVQPFAALDDLQLEAAAGECLERCLTGGDGPLVADACYVAPATGSELTGAILITLVPGGDPGEDASFGWREAPLDDAVARRLGQPHLTWILVQPASRRRGLGEALLRRSIASLREIGYASLWSTFLLGNDASAFWHWRQGFQLAEYPRIGRKRRGDE